MPETRLNFKKAVWGNKLFWIPVIFVVALIFSLFVFIAPEEGGEATFMSMAIIALIGYFYGPGWGFSISVLFGCVMFLIHGRMPEINYLEKYITSIAGQEVYIGELVDYIAGYGLMGFAAVSFRKTRGTRYEFLLSFGIAATLRFVEGALNCRIFYEPMYGETLRDIAYCLAYSFWYIGTETLLSCAVLLMPRVADCVLYLKKAATEKYEINRNYP